MEKLDTGPKQKITGALREHREAILLMAAAAFLMSFPALLSRGAFPAGVDTPAHLFKAEALHRMVASHGQLFGWTGQWYTGYPILGLYAPVTYYLLLGFRTVFEDPTLYFNLFRVSLLFLTGLAAYFVTDRMIDDSRAAWFAGFLALTSVPIHNNLFAVGRVPYAAGLVVYLGCVYLLLRPEIYTRTINRYHVALSLALTLLVYTHPMTAYLLGFTGLFIAASYRDRLESLGLRPVVFVGGLAALLSLPYVTSLARHSYITDPFWIRTQVDANLSSHLDRVFNNVRPRYLGAVHVGLALLGVISSFFDRERFKTVAVLNLGFFYLLFWSYNLGVLEYLPLHSQFDIPRFEVMFALWGALVAAYGFRELLSLAEAYRYGRWMLFGGLALLVLVDVSPLVGTTENWTPRFEPGTDYGMNSSYRGMMVGARHWDDYLLPASLGVPDTFGWFQQGDPHYTFSQTLQSTGGLWYPSDPDYRKRDNSTLRKNLMRLSNTRYLLFAREGWTGDSKPRVIGQYYPVEHRLNRELYRATVEDADFERIYRSTYLDVFEFDTEMSYCERVEPVWIQQDYRERAVELLSTRAAFPEVPVRAGNNITRGNSDVEVSCSSDRPTRISIETGGPAWVLVKESYYPYWHRENGKPVYEAFGFMVTRVNGGAELIYDPQVDAGGARTLRS